MQFDCPFCNVDKARVVFRSGTVFGVWDRYPVSDGHLLVVTDRHVPDWFEASRDERLEILSAVDLARQIIQETYAPQGFNIGINVGASAGQTVPHLHVHAIPRYAGDVPDPRGGVRHVIPGRGNYLRPQPAGFGFQEDLAQDQLLICGGQDPFLPHLRACLDQAVRADLAVAFVLKSGVALVREHLRDLLDRGGQIRMVTGDYLGVTDPDALVELLDLTGNLQLRVFEAGTGTFHPKAYLTFDRHGLGTAFVGSSNLSSPALQGGVEWNYRVLRADANQGFGEVAAAFEALFAHPQTRPVDLDWIATYRERRQSPSRPPAAEVVQEPPEVPPEPHAIQREALAALQATRLAGNQAGLVVLATGLGKTWLAAFDSADPQFSRVLFVAHREEILAQAMQTFRRIRPLARLGLYSGTEKAPAADLLFASVQTLGKARHLESFSRDHFDYIVVDEFHHAAAPTYRRLIDHFTPRFLLGLTATPERMDGGDLLALCQENLVYRRDLMDGIEAGLLCPFHYYGVPDEVDYSNIPWRSSRFDEQELTNAVATISRVENALDQLHKHGGRRTLGFCCSQRHADFMADYFSERGVRAVAVHSGERSAPRASALEALAAGKLDVIFAVDMFNEGLDLPGVDTVLMLRPTESSIIWVQQFGRGLRRAPEKTVLKVIDYIGNHRTFLVKVRTLFQPLRGSQDSDAAIAATLRSLQQGKIELPAGCEITYELETIDILKSLLRTRAADEAILAFYTDFRERHGVRPTALELHHSGYSPRALRKTHTSWTRFVKEMNDLTPSEVQAVEAVGEFLDALEVTPMTRSFKMLTLLAMLNEDSLPGRIEITRLATEFQRIARRSQTLRQDVGSHLEDLARVISLLESNPIKAWCEGKGTGGRAYFQYSAQEFSTDFTLPDGCRSDFQNLLREIVDWRLAEYLGRGRQPEGPDRIVSKVVASQDGFMLQLPDRGEVPGVPVGWVEVIANDQNCRAKFELEFVRVVEVDQTPPVNILGDLIQGWFGADAGKPGTGHQVVFEQTEQGLKIAPVGGQSVPTGAKVWGHYLREAIPPLFGGEFNPAIWNQGFVVAGRHVFLLVTLEKSGLNKDHRYEDHFLSADLFQWQSQNRTRQDSQHGRLISDPQRAGVDIHLFVRRHKVLAGKAAPFVYCGVVDFESWEGERPISVTWRLREAVPEPLRDALQVKPDQ